MTKRNRPTNSDPRYGLPGTGYRTTADSRSNVGATIIAWGFCIFLGLLVVLTFAAMSGGSQ